MPKYRFSWNAFDDRTVRALAEAYGYSGPREQSRAWLEGTVKRPTEDFVRATKDALVQTWLPEYPGAESIVDRLVDAGIGPMRAPRAQTGFVKYIADCRNSKRLRQYLREALISFGDADATPEEVAAGVDFTPRFATLTVAGQPADQRKPHAYQLEAWDRLNAHLAEARSTGRFQGLLVMPTGSGKTYTAVRWLCSQVLSQGKRVLWLAHRQELLSHAAAEFHRLAGYASPKEKLRVRIVSGAHCATSQIDPADDVVVASVHSLARRPDIAGELLADDRLFMVIDEAHHAPAKSYRDVIATLQSSPRSSILGLTATPTRTLEDERPILTRLFGGRVLHQVELTKLIEQRILARPIPVLVKTHAEVEQQITEEDRAHYDRFNDLSEEWLDRIAHLSGRNAVILDHYLANRAKYGPTLMFAINVPHAALLTERLKSHGVRADYVASYRPDGSDGEPMSVIQQFREGHLDVLINVQMVTEGVDLPRIDTVFLTRPTNSEILMRQMIGRALRGPAAGGGDKAYLVSFEDHWEKFRDWDSPFDLVPDITTIAGFETPPPPEQPVPPIERLYEHLPWETIRAVAAAMAHTSVEHKADAFEAVPDGWLVIERAEEDEGIKIPIALYKHQTPCWEALLEHIYRLDDAGKSSLDPSALYASFFGDCDMPAPSDHHVRLVIEHLRAGGERPQIEPLAGRDLCDPYAVAKRIHDGNLGRREQTELVGRSFTKLAQAIYSSLREYQAAIDDALYELDHPDESTRVPRAIPIFDPRSDQRLRPGPTHDLQALMTDVLERGGELLGVPHLRYEGTLEWSKRLLKGWYGMAYYRDSPPRIKINCLLDSPDVTPETMKFLLWHEYLHVHLQQLHTKTFRELERKWPGQVEAHRELDTLNERFGVSYW